MNFLKVLVKLLCAFTIILASSAFAVEDRIEMDQTIISGNQELPKVLYIVPWHEGDQTPITAHEPQLSLQQLFTPIHPYEFRRSLLNHRNLTNHPNHDLKETN